MLQLLLSICDCTLPESGVSPDQLYDAGKCCC